MPGGALFHSSMVLFTEVYHIAWFARRAVEIAEAVVLSGGLVMALEVVTE